MYGECCEFCIARLTICFSECVRVRVEKWTGYLFSDLFYLCPWLFCFKSSQIASSEGSHFRMKWQALHCLAYDHLSLDNTILTTQSNLLPLDTWFAHTASSFQTCLAVLVVLKRLIHIMQVRASRGRIQFRRKLPKPSMHAVFLLPLSRGISRWKRCMTSLQGMRRCSLRSNQNLTVSHRNWNLLGQICATVLVEVCKTWFVSYSWMWLLPKVLKQTRRFDWWLAVLWSPACIAAASQDCCCTFLASFRLPSCQAADMSSPAHRVLFLVAIFVYHLLIAFVLSSRWKVFACGTSLVLSSSAALCLLSWRRRKKQRVW